MSAPRFSVLRLSVPARPSRSPICSIQRFPRNGRSIRRPAGLTQATFITGRSRQSRTIPSRHNNLLSGMRRTTHQVIGESRETVPAIRIHRDNPVIATEHVAAFPPAIIRFLEVPFLTVAAPALRQPAGTIA